MLIFNLPVTTKRWQRDLRASNVWFPYVMKIFECMKEEMRGIVANVAMLVLVTFWILIYSCLYY